MPTYKRRGVKSRIKGKGSSSIYEPKAQALL